MGKEKKARIVEEFRGGSMAKTFLIEKNDELFVRKIAENSEDGLGAEKLMEQWRWIVEFNIQCPDILPDVNFFVLGQDNCYYDMQYFDMIQLREALLEHDEEPELIDQLIQTTVRIGGLIAQPSTIYQNSMSDYIEQKHLQKMIERCKSISHLGIGTTEYISVNGHKLKNVGLIIAEILKDKDLYELLSPKQWYLSHGDFTLQNILTDGQFVKIIDPRGEGPDSLYYDISKLYQSCHGKYDLLTENNFECKYNLKSTIPSIRYKIFSHVEEMDKIFKKIKMLIPVFYKIDDPRWDLIARFFEGSHFISMMPFRIKESEELALTCYGIGVTILNDVLEEWQVVKRQYQR